MAILDQKPNQSFTHAVSELSKSPKQSKTAILSQKLSTIYTENEKGKLSTPRNI